MSRYIAAGILVGLLGLNHFAARIHALPQSASQGTSPTLDLQQVLPQTFLQNIRRLELLGNWGESVHGLRMSILEDDEDDAELSNNPDWQEFPHLSNDCEELGGPYCGPGSFPSGPRGMRSHILLEIRNSGDQDFTIGIGGGCGMRASGVTSDVEIALTDSRGTSFPLHFHGIGPPYQPGCAGAVAVFSVTIGTRKSFAAVLDLGKYIDLSGNQSYAMTHLPAGMYTIQAQLDVKSPSGTPASALADLGILNSSTIQVRFESDFSIFPFFKRPTR
jgi:hypothetical protein